MPTNILIPQFAANVEEVTLSDWLVSEGDSIEKGDLLLTVETEKTTYDIEAEKSGNIHIVVAEGENIQIGEIVGMIAESEEELATIDDKNLGENQGVVIEKDNKLLSPIEISTANVNKGIDPIKISPVARKMAKENQIDPAIIEGSGPKGRIVKKDIEKVILLSADQTNSKTSENKKLAARIIPLKGMQKTIAERLHRSLANTAQMTIIGEMEVSTMVQFRNNLVKQEQVLGIKIGYIDILACLIGEALKDFPEINSSLTSEGIVIWKDINIGVAVAVGDGLIVPVVHQITEKKLVDISKNIKSSFQKAREGILKSEDVMGGTFTFSTVGKEAESLYQTPILNPSESAILAMGSIRDKPLVRDNEIVIRPVMTWSFTFDHQIINGYKAELFMTKLRELISEVDIHLMVNIK